MESAVQSTPSAAGLTTPTAGVVDGARERVSGAMESARGRAGNLQAQLADVMDTGAGALRQHASGGTAASPADGLVAGALAAVAPRLAGQEALVATVLENGATWLRENDLTDLEARVIEQVERHPVRTLGIAAALGFLLARRTR